MQRYLVAVLFLVCALSTFFEGTVETGLGHKWLGTSEIVVALISILCISRLKANLEPGSFSRNRAPAKITRR